MFINKILFEKLDILIIVYFDDILIYIENPSQNQVNAVYWVLEQLQWDGLYAKQKKWCFH